MVRRLHNEYMDMLVEGGALGGLALICAAAAGIAWVRRVASIDNGLPYVGVFACVILQSLVSFPLHVLPTLVVFCMACVFGLAESRDVARGSGAGMAVSVPRLRWIAAAGLAAAWLACTPTVVRRVVGEREHRTAKRLVVQDRHGAARKAVDRGLRADPGSFDFMLTKARLQYHFFYTDSARSTLEQMRTIGEDIDALKLHGLVLWEQREYASAKRVYHRLATAFPTHVTPCYMLGRLYHRTGEQGKARKWLTRCLRNPATSRKGRLEKMLAEGMLERAWVGEGERTGGTR
jgi:hypothetical protein